MRNLHYNPLTFNSNKTNSLFKQFVSLIVFYSMLLLPITQLSYANPVTTDKAGTPARKQQCFTCSAGNSDNLLAQLSTLGKKSQLNPFSPIIRSRFDGSVVNFVSTAKGNLSFATTDFSYLTGSLPLTFQRTYTSDRTEDRGLGTGWSFTFDDRITVQGNTATMMTSNGDKVLFKKDQQKFVLTTANASLHQSFELQDNLIKEQLGGLTRLYQKKGNTFYLSEISDNNENKIKLNLEDSGRVLKIEDSHNGYLTLNWQGSNLKSVAECRA